MYPVAVTSALAVATQAKSNSNLADKLNQATSNKIKRQMLTSQLKILRSLWIKCSDKMDSWPTTEAVFNSEKASHHTRRSVGGLILQVVQNSTPGKDPPKMKKPLTILEVDTLLSVSSQEMVWIIGVAPNRLPQEITCPTILSQLMSKSTRLQFWTRSLSLWMNKKAKKIVLLNPLKVRLGARNSLRVASSYGSRPSAPSSVITWMKKIWLAAPRALL